MKHDVINAYQLAEYGLSYSTAAKMRMRGDGPPFYKIGARVCYRRSDVEAWLDSKKVVSVAETRATAGMACIASDPKITGGE
jgi:predicted DNA-binding transcriptional regulator AlpA